MKIGFVINDFATEKASYTTTHLAMAARHRGHEARYMSVGGIEVMRGEGYVLTQEFLPEATEGDTRLFMMNGEPLRSGDRYAVLRRNRGQGDGDIRSNISAGAGWCWRRWTTPCYGWRNWWGRSCARTGCFWWDWISSPDG